MGTIITALKSVRNRATVDHDIVMGRRGEQSAGRGRKSGREDKIVFCACELRRAPLREWRRKTKGGTSSSKQLFLFRNK